MIDLRRPPRAASNRVRAGIQVIARAADILRVLEGKEQGLSLSQLAKELSLPRSTVQRIVAALDDENFLIAASPTARVRLGPALLQIAKSVRFELAQIARPYLEELSRETGETVDLAVLDGVKAVFVDQVQGTRRLRAVSAMGVSFPLYCTANGKAMLAALDPESFSRLKPRIRLTGADSGAARTWPELEAELAQVRETGIAYDREEHSSGISAIGAAIQGLEGEMAALSIPVPVVRFSEIEKQLVASLRRSAGELQELLTMKGGAPGTRQAATGSVSG
jgi:DNA-binding IclR family transcriptional regulator